MLITRTSPQPVRQLSRRPILMLMKSMNMTRKTSTTQITKMLQRGVKTSNLKIIMAFHRAREPPKINLRMETNLKIQMRTSAGMSELLRLPFV